MFWNITLALLIAGVTAVIAGLGGHLASTKAWHKWVFWGGAVVVWALTGFQTYRNEDAQTGLQAQLDRIQHNTEQPQPAPIVNVSPPVVNIPGAPQHSHAEFLQPTSITALPLLPYHEGEQVYLNENYWDSGDFPLANPGMGAVVVVVPDGQDSGRTWADYNRRVKLEFFGGTLPALHNPAAFQYHTINGPVLTKSEASDLMALPAVKKLCVLAKLQWSDASGKYETYSSYCLMHEMDGSFNWHLGRKDGEEHKLGK